jgi:hypothetical protein
MDALQAEAGPIHPDPCHGLGQFLVEFARIVLDRDIDLSQQINYRRQVVDNTR